MTVSLCKSKQPKYRNKYERELRLRNPDFAAKQRQNSNKWRKKYPKRKSYYDWAYHIQKAYGMSPSQYEEMLANQGGGCKFCGRRLIKNRLPVDHNHSTGKVRGILCTPCNRALGILEPNIDKVVAYLK